MNEQTFTTEVIPPVKIKLMRYQKGDYGWELTCTPEATPENIGKTVSAVEMADSMLRRTYGVKPE